MTELLSKNKFSYIKSLQQSKFRQKYRKFTVEGQKSVSEFIKHNKFELDCIVITENGEVLENDTINLKIFSCKTDEMRSLSNLVTPTNIIGVFNMKDSTVEEVLKKEDVALLLDGIQDPGNVGTIIRSADWFGIRNVIRSTSSADFYHPKVVQATMGSLNNINFSTIEDISLLHGKSLYGMDMNGVSIKKIHRDKNQVFVLGSEGQGISKEIKALCKQFISIEGDQRKVAESLNVGIATGILLYHLSDLE